MRRKSPFVIVTSSRDILRTAQEESAHPNQAQRSELPAPCSHPKPSLPVLAWLVFYSRSTRLLSDRSLLPRNMPGERSFPALLLVFPGAQGEDQAATELRPRRPRFPVGREHREDGSTGRAAAPGARSRSPDPR